ncbi:MAG: glycoside hydrolase family 13 protein [Clostridiales bacterium]|jgi:glycosidase|nr:glycoside hydrolase family 13 protein [Clostridiales bacterium]
MYHPLYHKNPAGAVESGEVFETVFPVPSDWGVHGVALIVLCPGGGELKFSLNFIRETNGETFFGGSAVINGEGLYRYRFEAYADYGVLFFGRGGDGTAVRGDFLPMWSLTVTKRGFKTPDFAKGGVVYHIFADRFHRAGDSVFDKDGTLHQDWNEAPAVAEPGEPYLANDFFGGNLRGITEKLDYLKSLSVNIIYLSPIFESYSNHRYDTGDYLKIDRLLGGEDDFKNLIEEAEKRGIGVMLDGVFNHTGSDSLYFNKRGSYPSLGAYQSESSPYAGWYYFDEFPDKYGCWWGITVVPTVNKDAAGYRELVFGSGGIIDKWMRFGIKGWRLDVADELPADFVYELRLEIKKRDGDCLIIGEVWEDASEKISYGTMRPYLQGAQLDGVMNYPFREAILKYAANGSAYDFVCAVTALAEHYPKQCLDVCMTLIGTHDTVRALTALSGVSGFGMPKKRQAEFKLSKEEYQLGVARLKLAAALQFTLPGIPSVYYGDEVGAQGFDDPLNRMPYPWGRENAEILQFYRALGKLRAANRSEFSGGFRFLRADFSATEVLCGDTSGNKRAKHAEESPSAAYAVRNSVLMNAGRRDTAPLNTSDLSAVLAYERYSVNGSITVYANSSLNTALIYLPDCVNALNGERLAGAFILQPYGFVIVKCGGNGGA